MSIVDEWLSQKGLKFEELSHEERDTYVKMLEVAEAHPISIEDWKTFISQMITGIQSELVMTKDGTQKSIDGKARLRNMIVMQNFLNTPERAKKDLERYYKL